MTSDDGRIFSKQKPSPPNTIEIDSTSLMEIEEHHQTNIENNNRDGTPFSSTSSNMNANLNLNPSETINQTSPAKILNNSINTDMLTKSVNKISYPNEEESIFMKDTSNEENNSQNEQNISRELVQHYQSKLNPDEATVAQQQNNLKETEKASNAQSIQPLRNSENTTISIEMPNVVIHSGPAPPKKIIQTVKATPSIPNATIKPNLKKKISHSRRKKKADRDAESSGTNTESEGNNSNYDDDFDDEDEYKPKKLLKTHHLNNNSDSEVIVMTSDDENSLAKRKPARATKKPKVFEDFETSSPNCLTPQAVDIQKTDLVTNLLPQQPQVEQLQVQPTKAKQFARKSTAPLTTSNSTQNILANNISNNQHQLKAQQMALLNVKSTLNAKSPITAVLSTHHHHQNQSSSNKISSGNSLNSNSILKPLVNESNTQQHTQATSTTPVKQFRNKIVSCKPFCQSKATECYPNMKDASTQVDLDEIKLQHTVVPVPVPINVPIPMFMFQAPMPMPILLPVPIPVPVFIPTTKKTYERVERRIKKLRKKLPSDPLEFELLLYAEKLAREEGIPGFEDSSDGESEPEFEPMDTSSSSIPMLKTKSKSYNQDHQTNNNSESEKDMTQMIQQQQQQLQPSDQEGSFKWFFGVKVFNAWLTTKLEYLKISSSSNKNLVLLSQANRLPNDLVKLKNEELNSLLTEFIQEVRKPTGELYAPESLYYLCLGIQHYLQENGRTENIFLDFNLFDNFQASLNEIALKYQIRINSEGLIISRIEEEILWESKQLGAFSPFVLLNTILFFNTKYFFLDKKESHMQLSFTNVKKHSKRNIGPNGEDFGKTVFLRYYPDFQGLEQVIYEQGENYDNPLRCPVELYNFYLSKCPESVKNRSDVFYLLPEKASVPSSPVWFSSQPLSPKVLDRMLNRIKMVKEVNELLIAAAPATTQAASLI